jgi:prevent-host-death family protein
MANVTVRELRNHGGDVLDRVTRGESLVVTRDGVAVAQLRPLAPQGVSAEELIARRRALPDVDPDALRAAVDTVLDPGL